MASPKNGADDKFGTEVEIVATSSDTLAMGSEAPVREKALLRKLDRQLMPAVALLYLMCFLDRSNLGNAKLEGMLGELHMTEDSYHLGLSLFFISYIAFEIPCNIVLKKTTPRFWLPTLTMAWGIVTTLFGILQNTEGFFAARFFLGVAEAGLFPGVVYYFSMWYKRRERQSRIALFFSAASLAGAFGGILAWCIRKMRGIVWQTGWRWIFILGLATCLVSVGAIRFIHNYPKNASFLSPDEKAFVHQRLAVDSDATREEKFTWGAVVECLKDPNCWLYGLLAHTSALPLYTLSLFLPTIIASLGYTAASAQLLTVPPYAFACVTTVGLALLSERYGRRSLFVAGAALFGALGYGLLLGNTEPTTRPGLSYAGTFLAAAGLYSATGIAVSWPALNVSGQTKRAVAMGLQTSVANLGGLFGMQLYRAADGPRYVMGHAVALAYLLVNAAVALVLGWRLRAENKRRDALAPEITDVGAVDDWMGDSDPRWRYQD